MSAATTAADRRVSAALLLDRAIEALTERGACPNCRWPVHCSNGRTWVHTLTGLYRCPPGIGAEGDGFAGVPLTEDERTSIAETAYTDGMDEGREECAMGHDDIADDAEAEGRVKMLDEVRDTLDAAVAAVGDAADADALRAALTEAWEGIAP